MRNVIVTGANGFLGSTLIKKLVEKNVNVVAIDRTFVGNRLPESELVKRIESNLSDVEELKQKIAEISRDTGYDAFYHFAWAGVNGSQKADPFVQLKNIENAVKCASLAKTANCKKLLCAGTVAEQSVKSLPNIKKTSGGMMYASAKCSARLMLETYCKNISLDFIWMQFSNIYGPGNKTGNLVSYTLSQLSEDEDAEYGPAEQPYDFIYIDDLMDAIVQLGDRHMKGNYYYIGSGHPEVLKDYLFEIGRLCGKEDKICIGRRPDDGIKYSWDMFNIKPLEEEIGDYAKTSFEQGIKNTIEAL